MSPTPRPPPAWLSIADYGRDYAVSPKTVRKWIECGLLATYRVGRLIRVENHSPNTTGKRKR
jgi:hypothetical protein